MNDSQTYPYETQLNIEFQPLELIDEKALADAGVARVPRTSAERPVAPPLPA